MTDRRDPEAEELRDRIEDLESTLVDLRERLDDDGREPPQIPRGLPGAGRRPPRPPRLRDVLRFTEEYTIPTLISILETNVRLLRLTGAALRALDPERSAMPADADGALDRAIDAGRGLSTDRLREGLDDLNDALAGTEASDPEARELLSEAESLSAEIQDRLREATDAADGRRDGADESSEAVSIDVNDAGEAGDGEEGGADGGDGDDPDEAPQPDVDAELDSIREEVRGTDGEPDGGDDADAGDDADTDAGDDADGTVAE